MSIKLSKYPRKLNLGGKMWDLYDGRSTKDEIEKQLETYEKMPINEAMKFKVIKQSHIIGDPVFLIYRSYK